MELPHQTGQLMQLIFYTLLTTLWHQHSPFNDLCPNVGVFKVSKAPAGCVPIALGQIIAYQEHPSNLTCNGTVINYTTLKNGTTPITSDGENMAAKFTICIGSSCYSVYGKIFGETFGFATPWGAKACLQDFGYENVSLHWGYSDFRIIQSIDNDCPVFISAVSGIVSGHAWVIDGYIQRDHVIRPSGEIESSQNLVHCNWGWGHSNNGFFASGIFKTDNPESFDYSSGNGKNKYFKRLLNTITYDKPTN